MLNAPGQFSTLTQQVADAIGSNIERGVWAEQLPPERYLARSLQVSRRTLRSAIEILRQQKVLLTQPGLGSQITRAKRPKARSAARHEVVGLLMPQSFDHMKPSTMVFIDELRTLLYAKGFRLEVHVGHRYYSNRPSAALFELTSKHPADGWILIYSNPIIEAGIDYRQGIPLPASFLLDIDGVVRYVSRPERVGEFLRPELVLDVLEQMPDQQADTTPASART